MSSPRYKSGAALFDAWRHDVLEGEPPERWPFGPGAFDVDFGPGQVVLIGGAPGQGKTAFTMQAALDMARVCSDLRVLIVNVEMPPEVLLNRQLARLSGVPLDAIQGRQVACLAEAGRNAIADGLAALRPVLERLAFLEAPYTLEHAAAAADTFGARALVLDYVQRIAPPGEHATKREAMEQSMDLLRRMADAGAGIVAVSAVARQKGTSGSSYGGLNLASFRDSSELEFGADSAYVLTDGGAPDGPPLTALRCFKRRHGEPKDLLMSFDRQTQQFRRAFDGANADYVEVLGDDGEF